MRGTVFRYSSTGALVLFSPDIPPGGLPAETLTATISGTSVCAGCFFSPVGSTWFKVSGTLDGTYSLIRAGPSSLQWTTTTVPGLTVTMWSNAACTVPAATPIPLLALTFNCAVKQWEFAAGASVLGAVTNLWGPTSITPPAGTVQLPCDVVANVVSINNPFTSCASATATNGLIAGGSVSIPLCP